MSIGATKIAFELFDLSTANALSTESITLYNTRSFEMIAFRASLAVAGQINFYESIDGLSRFARRVYHLEANAFVTSVLAFTSGNFIAVVAGIQNFQIEKVTALAATTLTFVGRQTFGRGADGSILGPAGPDDKDYIDCLGGPSARIGSTGSPITVRAFLANLLTTTATAIDPWTGSFLSITSTIADNDVIIDDTGVFSAMDFQYRQQAADAFNYAHPETRPVLRVVASGAAANDPILYGFQIDVSTVDFADVVGIGFSVYAVSNYDYASNSGLLHPQDANQNYARTQCTIRDSTGVAIWQANKIDIPFNGTDTERASLYPLDVAAFTVTPAVPGTSSQAYPRRRYSSTAGTTWTAAGDAPQSDGITGSIQQFKNAQTQYYDLEFSLERNQTTDSMSGFYQSPTGYDIDGEPDDIAPLSPSSAITWDFTDATTLYFSRTLNNAVGTGNQLSEDMRDPTLSGAGGSGFPNPPAGVGALPETQTLYYKDIFLRRRPFSYPTCTNYSIIIT